MNTMKLGSSDLDVTRVGLGCMRMAAKSVDEAARVIQSALDNGINFFDHADIYGAGESERIFAAAFKTLDVERKDIILQSKVGINQAEGTFDFSYEHIIKATEGILERLETEYLDVLLLHRPDTLMEPKEIAKAFKELHNSGKVKYFGVSNCNPYQVELIESELEFKLVANQVQFSMMHTTMIDEGINVNMSNDPSIVRTSGLLETSRLKNITLQAWSPYQFGFFEGVFIDNQKFPELNEALQHVADKYNVTKTSIATSWILRHPANMQVIAGSMNPDRIKEIAAGSTVTLTRQEWYDLYKAAGNILP